VVRIKVDIDGNSLLTELSMEAFDEMNLDIGREVFVIIKLRRLRYVEEFDDSQG
jgi:ABC-type molybdate transport system ATPase subunit